MKLKLLFIFLTFKFNIASLAQTAREIAKDCLPSTVSLVMEDHFKQAISFGSGFIIEDGKVITNLHVIEGAKSGLAFGIGSSLKHKIQGYFAIDRQNDLVILSIPSLTGKSLSLADSSPEIGEKVFAIGNPKGLSGTISEGIVSGLRTFGKNELIQITAPISPGSSGGPVINNLAQVIGVAVGTINSGQNLNFAIPASVLKSLLDKDIGTISPLNILKGATAPKISENEINIRDGVVLRDWKYKTGQTNYDEVELYHICVASISFKNQLPHTIKNIRVIFILYDKSGIPVDYFEKSYFNGSGVEGIKPFLAKTVTFDMGDWITHRALRKESGENLKVRILDFEIVEE